MDGTWNFQEYLNVTGQNPNDSFEYYETLNAYLAGPGIRYSADVVWSGNSSSECLFNFKWVNQNPTCLYYAILSKREN